MRSIKVNGRSAFYRTNRQTGNKVLLEERIRARNGNDDNDCDCHTNGFGRHRVTVLLQTQTCAGVIGDVLQVLHHVVQQCLQGYQLGIRNIQGGLEPVIPVKNSAIVAKTGLEMGTTIRQKIFIWDAPSIFADSMMESGTVVRKKVLQIITLKLLIASGRIRHQMVLFKRSILATTT